MAEMEIPLRGGRTTPGVTKVGRTVRRPLTGDRTLQHALLRHLERKRFAEAPRFLGVDEQGREILSFLEGEVPEDLGWFTDAQLVAAAGLLRRFHDATGDFAVVCDRGAEVMCHNDWAPPNAVFVAGVPRGIIDFDAAWPGPRLWDLGYSAFTWLDLGNAAHSSEEQLRRLAVFADAYGLADCSREQIAVCALARQETLATSARTRGLAVMANWAAESAAWTATNIVEPLLLRGMGR